jgi:hypothetical protein
MRDKSTSDAVDRAMQLADERFDRYFSDDPKWDFYWRGVRYGLCLGFLLGVIVVGGTWYWVSLS